MLLFNLALEFIINAFFFNDDTMHKIYEDKGDFDIIYQLPQTIYSSLISSAFNYILGMLALSQNLILNFKRIRRINNLNYRIITINKRINIQLIIYILSLVLFFFFFSGIIYQCFVLYMLILKYI